MKKGRKLLLLPVVAMLFTLFMGMHALAAEVETIVPPLLKADEMPMDENIAVYQYQLGAMEKWMSIPVQISKTGKVYIGVQNQSDVAEIMVTLSKSPDINDVHSTFELEEISANKYGMFISNAAKACTWYLHVLGDADHLDKDVAITIKAYEQEIPTVRSSDVRLSKTSVTWNGKAQKPSITAIDRNGDKISGSNYTVKYSNNKNAGQATATITFKNNYQGTVKKTFTIMPKGTGLSKVTPIGKGFTVKWKKQGSQTTGYEIQYATAGSFKGAKTVGNIKSGVTSKNITKLKANKKYFVRIRTYKTAKVNGKNKKLCSGWSKAKTVVTKK